MNEVEGPFEAAVRTGAHVVGGFAERHPRLTGVLTNTAALFAPDGTVHLRRKTHLPRIERQYFRPGDGLSPVDTELGRIGMLVCADNSFPEPARVPAPAGAEDSLGTEPGTALAELRAETLLTARLYQPRYQDRRPELYGSLVEPGFPPGRPTETTARPARPRRRPAPRSRRRRRRRCGPGRAVARPASARPARWP